MTIVDKNMSESKITPEVQLLVQFNFNYATWLNSYCSTFGKHFPGINLLARGQRLPKLLKGSGGVVTDNVTADSTVVKIVGPQLVAIRDFVFEHRIKEFLDSDFAKDHSLHTTFPLLPKKLQDTLFRNLQTLCKVHSRYRATQNSIMKVLTPAMKDLQNSIDPTSTPQQAMKQLFSNANVMGQLMEQVTSNLFNGNGKGMMDMFDEMSLQTRGDGEKGADMSGFQKLMKKLPKEGVNEAMEEMQDIMPVIADKVTDMMGSGSDGFLKQATEMATELAQYPEKLVESGSGIEKLLKNVAEADKKEK